MEFSIPFNKNHAKWFVKDVLLAIKRYGMIAGGEVIGVALSGGKDSAVLLYALRYINLYSHLDFSLAAFHVKTGEYNTAPLSDWCGQIGVPYYEGRIRPRKPESLKSLCAACARLKRGELCNLLNPKKIQKIAFGHHATDVAETFFMNLVECRKLSVFQPKMRIPGAPLTLIRPLVYLEENTIRSIHRFARLPLLEYTCPYAENNNRSRYKRKIARLDKLFNKKDFARNLVKAWENTDKQALWSPLEQ